MGDALTPDWQITLSGTFVGDWLDDLAGMAALAAQVRFIFGTGGATVKVCLQSSMDQGTTAYDITVVNFATAPRTAIFGAAAMTTALSAPGEGGLNAHWARQNRRASSRACWATGCGSRSS